MEVRKNLHEPAQARGSRQKNTNRISGWYFLIGGGGGNRIRVRKPSTVSRSGYSGGFGGPCRSCLLTEYRGVLSVVFSKKRNRHLYLGSFNAGAQLRFATC